MSVKRTNKIRLQIAGIVVEIRSNFPHEAVNRKEANLWFKQYFSNFVYSGRESPNIKITVEVVKSLPSAAGADNVFRVIHPEDRTENWRIMKDRESYIYITPAKDKEQVAYFNKTFDRARVFVRPKKDKGFVWNVADITYDFLQVIFITYFAQRKLGIFLHGAGIKDSGGKGWIFMGKSGAGKTTLSRAWHRHSRAEVLNDDHVICRMIKGRYFIFGSPWCGEFRGFQSSYSGEAALEKIFFIHQRHENQAVALSSLEAFKLLYPNVFPNFWDKRSLENILSFGEELVKVIPCFSLGLMKNRNVISFVRSI